MSDNGKEFFEDWIDAEIDRLQKFEDCYGDSIAVGDADFPTEDTGENFEGAFDAWKRLQILKEPLLKELREQRVGEETL